MTLTPHVEQLVKDRVVVLNRLMELKAIMEKADMNTVGSDMMDVDNYVIALARYLTPDMPRSLYGDYDRRQQRRNRINRRREAIMFWVKVISIPTPTAAVLAAFVYWVSNR